MFKVFIIEFVFAKIEAAIHLRNLLLLFPMSQNNVRNQIWRQSQRNMNSCGDNIKQWLI